MPCLSKENIYTLSCSESPLEGGMGPYDDPMDGMGGPGGGGMPKAGKWGIAILIILLGCFRKGTKITMADGTEKNVEDINFGDMVLSYDETSGKLVPSRVIKVKEPQKVKSWYLVNGTIGVTGDHPLLTNYISTSDGQVINGKGEWTKIKDLQAGTNLTSISANKDSLISTNVVTSVEKQYDEIEVYNFEVEGTHNYFADGLLAHNKWGGPGPGGPTECFVGDTQIMMKDGPDKNIEDVKVGDEVLSYNVNTKQLEPKSVSEIFTQTHNLKDGDVTVKITYDNGTVTHNTIANPFWSKDKGFVAVDEERCNRVHEWVISSNNGEDIQNLSVGDTLYSYSDDDIDLQETKVTNIEYVMEEDIRTYDITVDDNHTFFANGILTHNSGAGGGGPSDIILKENIDLVGKSPSGINIYEFDYKNKSYGKGRYQGVMAQEVPEASYEKDGHLWVDYSKVDVDFKEI